MSRTVTATAHRSLTFDTPAPGSRVVAWLSVDLGPRQLVGAYDLTVGASWVSRRGQDGSETFGLDEAEDAIPLRAWEAVVRMVHLHH